MNRLDSVGQGELLWIRQ